LNETFIEWNGSKMNRTIRRVEKNVALFDFMFAFSNERTRADSFGDRLVEWKRSEIEVNG